MARKRGTKRNQPNEQGNSSNLNEQSTRAQQSFQGPLAPDFYGTDASNFQGNAGERSKVKEGSKTVSNNGKEQLESTENLKQKEWTFGTIDESGKDAPLTGNSPETKVIEETVKTLTENFKRKRNEFIQKVEVDPNYGMKRLQEDNSYDWAAALIGKGSPTKRGFLCCHIYRADILLHWLLSYCVLLYIILVFI
eukprot:jgi/Galph1/3212/GphlegSOOS_G1874.1